MEKKNEAQVLDKAQVPAIPDQQIAFLELIERLATNPDADVEKIQRIMDMQNQVYERDAEQAFNSAMGRVQNQIDLVVGKKYNDQTKSHYADLKSILLKTKEVYTTEGFSLMFYEGATDKPGHTRVCVDIMHGQGHTKQRYADIAVQTTGIAGKSMMTLVHGEGSAFSYGRRYLTCMIFNIPTGDDDDGNAAGVEYISEEQKKALVKEMSKRKIDVKKFTEHLKIKSVDELPVKRFNEAMKAAQSKPIPTGKTETPKEREPGEDDDSWMDGQGELV
jgi:hypothetical protein